MAEPINRTRSVFTFPVSSQQYLSLRCTQSGSDSFLYGIVPRTPSSGSLLLSPMLSSPLTFDRFHFDDVASPIFFGFGNYSSCDLGKPGSQSNGDGMSVAQDLTMDSVRKLSDNTVKENNASQQELSKHFPMSKLVTSIDEGQGQTAHRSKLTLDDASFPKCSPKRKSPHLWDFIARVVTNLAPENGRVLVSNLDSLPSLRIFSEFRNQSDATIGPGCPIPLPHLFEFSADVQLAGQAHGQSSSVGSDFQGERGRRRNIETALV